MQGVNLIPSARRIAAARAARVRMWCTCIAGYGAAVFALMLVSRVASVGTHASVAAQIQAKGDEITHAKTALATERKSLKAVLAEAQTTEIIYGQPDWSILLALLARATGDDIVLRNLRIAPDSSAAQLESPDRFAIHLSGLGKTQSAVSACVLRLERSGLLDQVKLIQSRREPFLDSEAVAFDVECTLSGRRGDRPSAPLVGSAAP